VVLIHIAFACLIMRCMVCADLANVPEIRPVM
ncbi:hypothetical protein A2U01_0043660, partial [Trifolium medium]|nr:hypothetical protein [Trifolium medium]